MHSNVFSLALYCIWQQHIYVHTHSVDGRYWCLSVVEGECRVARGPPHPPSLSSLQGPHPLPICQLCWSGGVTVPLPFPHITSTPHLEACTASRVTNWCTKLSLAPREVHMKTVIWSRAPKIRGGRQKLEKGQQIWEKSGRGTKVRIGQKQRLPKY